MTSDDLCRCIIGISPWCTDYHDTPVHRLHRYITMMFLSSRRVKWYIMWPEKVKFKVWPQVKVMTWLKHIVMPIIWFVSISQTHQTCFEACILSQSKVIARKLMVTYDDVTRPPLLIAEVSGAPVNLRRLFNTMFCMCWLLGVVLSQTKMKWFSFHWLINGEITTLTWP